VRPGATANRTRRGVQPQSFGDDAGSSICEQRVKSGYAKVTIRRQCIREAKLLHHNETHAIRERKFLIQMFQLLA